MNRTTFQQLLEKEEKTFTSEQPKLPKDFAFLYKEDVLKIYDLHLSRPPKYQTVHQLCPKCEGEGRINQVDGTSSSTKRQCPVCMGNMTVLGTVYFQ